MAAETSSRAAGTSVAIGPAHAPLAVLIDVPRLSRFAAAAASKSGAATKYDIAETPVVHGRWGSLVWGMYMPIGKNRQI